MKSGGERLANHVFRTMGAAATCLILTLKVPMQFTEISFIVLLYQALFLCVFARIQLSKNCKNSIFPQNSTKFFSKTQFTAIFSWKGMWIVVQIVSHTTLTWRIFVRTLKSKETQANFWKNSIFLGTKLNKKSKNSTFAYFLCNQKAKNAQKKSLRIRTYTL